MAAAGFLLLYILVDASSFASGNANAQYVNDCKRFFLKTPAGRIPIGCTFYCTTDKGGAMGVAGTECVNTTLNAAAKMVEDVEYICKLGICNHRLTCEHSGLSIGCRRKDFIPPKGYYPYYGKRE
uniref:Evasin n=1 Tax=Rhipicephalus appendiculatus TaxID=34631 RepID=A0A131YHC9_RHIAP